MNLESVRNNEDMVLDNLLHRLPDELRTRWMQQLKEKETSEQIVILRDVLSRRAEANNEKPHISDRLRVRSEIPEELIIAMRDIDRYADEINRGYNGRIMRCRKADTSRESPLYKVLFQPPLLPGQNSLQSEAAFQADLHALSQKHASLRVGVPRVYYFVSSDRVNVMAQEDVSHAISVKDILLRNVPLPPHFDIESTFKALADFTDRMHEEGYYHRDMREGNVMLNLEATADGEEPLAYIVDMGFSTKAGNEGEAYRGFTGPEDHAILQAVKESLQRHLTRQEATSV